MKIYLLIPINRQTEQTHNNAITAYANHADALTQKETYEADKVMNAAARFEIEECFLIGGKS